MKCKTYGHDRKLHVFLVQPKDGIGWFSGNLKKDNKCKCEKFIPLEKKGCGKVMPGHDCGYCDVSYTSDLASRSFYQKIL